MRCGCRILGSCERDEVARSRNGVFREGGRSTISLMADVAFGLFVGMLVKYNGWLRAELDSPVARCASPPA
jgi:hypothetical protein